MVKLCGYIKIYVLFSSCKELQYRDEQLQQMDVERAQRFIAKNKLINGEKLEQKI